MKRDHGMLYMVGAHPRRRTILLSLAGGSKRLSEIASEIFLPEDKAKYHLDMLSQIGFVKNRGDEYDLTEEGARFAREI